MRCDPAPLSLRTDSAYQGVATSITAFSKPLSFRSSPDDGAGDEMAPGVPSTSVDRGVSSIPNRASARSPTVSSEVYEVNSDSAAAISSATELESCPHS